LEKKEHALRGWNWGKAEFGKAELAFNVFRKMFATDKIRSFTSQTIPYPHPKVVLAIEDKFGFVVDLVIGTEDCRVEIRGSTKSFDGRGLTEKVTIYAVSNLRW